MIIKMNFMLFCEKGEMLLCFDDAECANMQNDYWWGRRWRNRNSFKNFNDLAFFVKNSHRLKRLGLTRALWRSFNLLQTFFLLSSRSATIYYCKTNQNNEVTNRNLWFLSFSFSYNLGTSFFCFLSIFLINFWLKNKIFWFFLFEVDYVSREAPVTDTNTIFKNRKTHSYLWCCFFYNLNVTTSLWPFNYIKNYVQTKSAVILERKRHGCEVGGAGCVRCMGMPIFFHGQPFRAGKWQPLDRLMEIMQLEMKMFCGHLWLFSF